VGDRASNHKKGQPGKTRRARPRTTPGSTRGGNRPVERNPRSPTSGKPRRAEPKRRPPRVDIPLETQRFIIASIEAGATFDAAALAAGMSPRTLRELRQRARSKHPTRSPLPHLKKFFDEVDRALGRRLVANEIRATDLDPRWAVKYGRQSLEAHADEEDPVRVPTAQELQAEIDVLISSGAFRSPRCQDHCPCPYHPQDGDSQ